MAIPFLSDIQFGDNTYIRLGDATSGDLQIYHNGTNDFIRSNGTYNIFEANNHIFRNLASDEDYAKFLGDGAVELYHNGSKKFTTTANGVNIHDSELGFAEGHSTASPGTAIIFAPYGAGTNIGGGEMQFYGGRSTGTAAGGSFKFYTSPTGSSGSSANAHILALTIDSSQNSTFAGLVTVGPGTTGSPYDANTFLHVKGTTRSIVQQSSTNDAYYMFGDAAANNVAWLGYSHSSGNLNLQAETSITLNKNTNVVGTFQAKGAIEVKDSDGSTTLSHGRLNSNGTEGYLTVSNGSNWGFIARGPANDPRIGAWYGGVLKIEGFHSSDGATGSNAIDFAQFQFGNNHFQMNAATSTFAGTIDSGAITALAKGSQFSSTGLYVNSTFKDVDSNTGVILGHNDTANGIGVVAGINQLSFLTYGSAWVQAMRITTSQQVIVGANAPRQTGARFSIQGGMSEFETTLTNNRDWENSPISILERANIGNGSTDDKYAPNLNFHWSAIVSNSLWMNSSGHLNYGSYSAAGVPATDGTFKAAHGLFNSSVEAGALLKFGTNGFADIVNIGTGAMRFKPSSQTLALTLTGANATFAGNVGIGNLGTYKLEVSEDGGDNGTADLLFLRNSNSTRAQTFQFQLDTNKDLVITGSSGAGGIKFVPGSRGTTFANNVYISGDLEVTGTTTTVNQTNLDISDNIIGLNRGATSNANDSGLIIERGSTGDNAAMIWDEANDRFVFGLTTSTPAATGSVSITATSDLAARDLDVNNVTCGRILATAASTGIHQLVNASTNSTVLQLISTGDNPDHALNFQTDHIYTSGLALHIGLDNNNIYLRGSQTTVGTTTPVSGYELTVSNGPGKSIAAAGEIYAPTVEIGSALLFSASTTSATTTTTVSTVATASYGAAFFDYVVHKGSNIRAGTIAACNDGTNVSFAETSTTDLGDTSDVTFTVDISGGAMRLRATTTSSTWTIKSFIRSL